jgi:hypothetical protein
MTLTRDQILESSDLKTVTVEVPEWGGSVLVRSMTGADRDAFEQTLTKKDEKGARVSDVSNLREKLTAMTVVDEAGNRLFSESDVQALAKKSAAALTRIADAAQVLNGMTAAAEDSAVKNSDADLNGASISV